MVINRVTNQEQLKDAYKIRTIVFVEEQHVPPEIELDEYDETAIHFVGYIDNEPIAASRLRLVDQYGKLERICVLKEERGKHYGIQMINQMEKHLIEQGIKKAKLNAQTHAETFYKILGFQTVSDEFMDAGIPHVTMEKDLS